MEANDLIRLIMGLLKRLPIGDRVVFWRLGKLVSRKVMPKSRKQKKAWKKKHPGTPNQLNARKNFTTNRQLAAHMTRQLRPLGVWRRAVEIYKPEGMNADNYLYHKNAHCMERGQFKKFRPLIVSLGDLDLPGRMECSHEGNRVTLRWLAEEPATDRLHVAIIHEDTPDSLLIVQTGDARRGDGSFSFDIAPHAAPSHIYPFFGSDNNGDFTGNDYFTIEN